MPMNAQNGDSNSFAQNRQSKSFGEDGDAGWDIGGPAFVREGCSLAQAAFRQFTLTRSGRLYYLIMRIVMRIQTWSIARFP
jgi:hypothetical protein